jgi:N-acetylmuramic acid 6-phosphate etherase
MPIWHRPDCPCLLSGVMLDHLLTEQVNPRSTDIDVQSTLAIVETMNVEDQFVALAVKTQLSKIALAVDSVVRAMEAGGRLFYIGAGTSGRLGVLDAAECPPTFNVSPELVQGIIAGGEAALARATEATEDDPETGKSDLVSRHFTGRDVLAGIAASGRTPYVLGAVKHARELGAVTIGISCTPDSELSRAVDIDIAPLTGPEVIAGSTRLKAGTATKLVLNMISTAAMIRLGHVYGNLMVNVQPRNAKLQARAQRIVAAVCGLSQDEAAALLARSGSSVKTAIVMWRLGLEREDAEERLASAGGRISIAVSHLK